MIRSAVAVGVLAMVAHSALAQSAYDSDRSSAEAAFSNDTLQLRYIDVPRADLGGGRASGTFFLSEERDIVLSADLLFPLDLDIPRFSIRFGPRAYAALLEQENNDVMSIAVGAEARLQLDRRRGLAIVGHAYLAPDILTFGSADQLTDLGARAELSLAPRLLGFAGMRWFEFDLTEGGGERTLQEELFAGVGWQF